MPMKHGYSHGLSIFVCTLFSSILIKYIEPLFPKFTNALEYIAKFFINHLKIPLPENFLIILLVACFLGVLWGIGFKIRYDR